MELKTSILIVAPHEVQAIAVPLLKRYSPDVVTRVPAHLSVLFPFVAVERLVEASAIMQQLCNDVAPFEVTMQGYGNFPGVAFMKPADPSRIQAVFRKIFAAFPDCPPYGGEFGTDLHPHMTVGEFASEAEQRDAILHDYAPITFTVRRLHIMYGPRYLALPWITYAVIDLKG